MAEPIKFILRYSRGFAGKMVPNPNGSWCEYDERFRVTAPCNPIPRYGVGATGGMIQIPNGRWCVYEECFEEVFDTARENTNVLIVGNYFGKKMTQVEPSEAKTWKTFQIDLVVAGDLTLRKRAESALNCLENRLEAIEASGYSIFSVEFVKEGSIVPKEFRKGFLVIARKNEQCRKRRKSATGLSRYLRRKTARITRR